MLIKRLASDDQLVKALSRYTLDGRKLNLQNSKLITVDFKLQNRNKVAVFLENLMVVLHPVSF